MRSVFAVAVVLSFITVLFQIAHPAHSEPFGTTQVLDETLVADVTGTALAFMAPRTLEAIPIPQMAIWGLSGLTTLDPKFTPELRDNTVRLLVNAHPLIELPAPVATDPRAWGALAARVSRAAWDGSEVIRRGGNGTLVRTFFDELFNHFDPYSRYTPPDDANADRDRRVGRAGIGAKIEQRNGSFVVATVVADGPAARAGVRAGDRITAVDDVATADADLDDVNDMIEGPDATTTTLTLRGRDGRSRQVEVERIVETPNTVFLSKVRDIVSIRITSFASDTSDRFRRAVVQGVGGGRGIRGVVIDLRGNRGGLLREAVAAAQTLIAHGTIARTLGRDPEADHDFQADGDDLAHGLPVIVVVDGRSASSAEILAAALADQGRAVVVGSSTLGKGLVQTVITLPDDGELFVTWSRVLAPAGWPIQGLGVLPQVCTSLGQAQTDDQLHALRDGRVLLALALQQHHAARPGIPPADVLEIRSACPATEGRDADMDVARFLLANRAAYTTALLQPAGG